MKLGIGIEFTKKYKKKTNYYDIFKIERSKRIYFLDKLY